MLIFSEEKICVGACITSVFARTSFCSDLLQLGKTLFSFQSIISCFKLSKLIPCIDYGIHCLEIFLIGGPIEIFLIGGPILMMLIENKVGSNLRSVLSTSCINSAVYFHGIWCGMSVSSIQTNGGMTNQNEIMLNHTAAAATSPYSK